MTHELYDEWEEDNDPDTMEMPCLCDCGKWFDLNDGYPARYSNVVICKRCHQIDLEEDDEIDDPNDSRNI